MLPGIHNHDRIYPEIKVVFLSPNTTRDTSLWISQSQPPSNWTVWVQSTRLFAYPARNMHLKYWKRHSIWSVVNNTKDSCDERKVSTTSDCWNKSFSIFHLKTLFPQKQSDKSFTNPTPALEIQLLNLWLLKTTLKDEKGDVMITKPGRLMTGNT